MKIVQIQGLLICGYFIAQTVSFSTRFSCNHAIFRARVSPHLRQPSLVTTQWQHSVHLKTGRIIPDGGNSSNSDKPSLVRETLAGVTVAFSLLSKAIACSNIVGVNPLVGIWSSVVMGITAPLIGARDGVISGTAAVVIVPLSALTQTHGIEYMTLCILVSAIMQGIFGMLRLAKTADLVSDQVLSGFLNGLGFILLLSQASVFRAAATTGALVPCVAMSALCFSIVQILPLFTKAVPSSLVGLVVASVVGRALKMPLATLSSTAAEGTFSGGLTSLPQLVHLGQLRNQISSSAALKRVMPAAVSITIIALVETLLAGKVVDDMTMKNLCALSDKDTVKTEDKVEFSSKRNLLNYDVPTLSVLAMSAGNVISSFLGGFGGCGLIPQTVLNLKSGGGGPWSSISYAIAMASFVVFFAPLVGKISQAALAGIMIAIACDTVSWGPSAKAVKAAIDPSSHPDVNGGAVSRTQRSIELLALGISSYICFFGNLAIGIISGVALQRGLLSIYRRLDSRGS